MRFVLPTTYARTRIYRPRKEAVTHEPFDHADINDVRVQTDDGLELNGWYALSRADHDGPRPLILYFAGAGGHRGYRTAAIELFTQLGCDLLLVDYRGYGDNDGQPNERNQARDAWSTWEFAIRELHVPAERIVICGESLGGAVGVRLTSELCRRDIVPGGLILLATFAHMLDVVAKFFPRHLAFFFLFDRFPSARRIRHVTCPILCIHGTRDRLVPIEVGRRLFEAAPQQSQDGLPKQFLAVPEIDHNDLLDDGRDMVEGTIASFLKHVPPLSRRKTADPSTPPRSGVMQPLQ